MIEDPDPVATEDVGEDEPGCGRAPADGAVAGHPPNGHKSCVEQLGPG